MATVSIPLALKDLTGGVRHAEVEGATVREIIAGLETMFPGIEARIHDNGKMRPTLAWVIDGKIAAGGLDTPVEPDSEVNVLPAFGGG